MDDDASGADGNVKSDMPPKVIFNSPELACFHEAGHAEVALSHGAQIAEIVLYREEPRSYGRARVSRTEKQRRPIALGGFAAEYRLYRAGRLLKQDGTPPSEKEFISYALNNALEDRINFFGGDHQQSDGQWPGDLDNQFMSFAIGYADDNMRFDLVEQIAAELLAAGQLDEAAILKILGSHTVAMPKT